METSVPAFTPSHWDKVCSIATQHRLLTEDERRQITTVAPPGDFVISAIAAAEEAKKKMDARSWYCSDKDGKEVLVRESVGSGM
jgi:hypothetical protein